jgi:hypothetical protein
VARPTKLTPTVRDRIVQAVKAGNYMEAAARAAGISASTLYRWLERGENETAGIYHDFCDAVRRAEAEAEVHAVATVRRAMSEDWRAAVAYLERRHPTRWRRHTTTEHVGADGGPIRTHETKIDPSQLSDAEIESLLELYERTAKPD